MIGDVNLFLTPDDEDEDNNTDSDNTNTNRNKKDSTVFGEEVRPIVGEIEIMIASPAHQGRGLGRSILLAFLWYILSSLNTITTEYGHTLASKRKPAYYVKYLRVKIEKDNVRSVKLFESVGFKKVTETPNYFGELELRLVVNEEELMGQVEEMMEGVVPRRIGYRLVRKEERKEKGE
jgi:GNAT superfamily N-acetyltransferase